MMHAALSRLADASALLADRRAQYSDGDRGATVEPARKGTHGLAADICYAATTKGGREFEVEGGDSASLTRTLGVVVVMVYWCLMCAPQHVIRA